MLNFPTLVPGGVAVKSSDEPWAAGNSDGYVRYNDIYGNQIFSDKDDVWRIKESDSNVFRVRKGGGGQVYS